MSIFLLFAGVATVWSFFQLDETIDAVRGKWILNHYPLYLNKMREIQRNQGISLLEQITEYVKPQDRLAWKNRYDALIL